MSEILREYLIRLGWDVRGADTVRRELDAQNAALRRQSDIIDQLTNRQNRLNLQQRTGAAPTTQAINQQTQATNQLAQAGQALALTAPGLVRQARLLQTVSTAARGAGVAIGHLIGVTRATGTAAHSAMTILSGSAQLLSIAAQRAVTALGGGTIMGGGIAGGGGGGGGGGLTGATARMTTAHRAAVGPLNTLIRQIQILGTTYIGVHAITSTIKELGALHDQSRRVGSSVNNIRAFEQAWAAAGGTVAEASAAMDSLKEAQIQPGNVALLQHFGVTATDTAEQLLQLGEAYAKMPLFSAVNFGQRFGQSASQVKTLRDEHGQLRLEYEKNVKFLKSFGVDAATAARNAKELAVQASRFGMGMAQVRDAFFLGAAGGSGGFMGKINAWLEGGSGEKLAAIAKEIGDSLGDWLTLEGGGGDRFLKWLTAVSTTGSPESEGWKRFFTEITEGASTSVREVLALVRAFERLLGFLRDTDRFFSSKGGMGAAGRAVRGGIGLPKTSLDIESEGAITGTDPEAVRAHERARMEQLRQARAREEGKSIWRRLLETFSTDIKVYDDFGDPGTAPPAPQPDTASPEARDYIRRRRGETSGTLGGSEGTDALAGGINADKLEDPISKIEDNTEETVKELKRVGSIWEKIANLMPSWAEQAARKDGGGGGGGGGGGDGGGGGGGGGGGPGEGSGGGGKMPTGDRAKNAAEFNAGMKEAGLGSVQRAAAMGSAEQESGFNPGAWNKREGAGGIIQWRANRQAALRRFAASRGEQGMGSARTQGVFFGKEAQGQMPGSDQSRGSRRFLAATTVDEASRALHGNIRWGHTGGRHGFARKWASQVDRDDIAKGGGGAEPGGSGSMAERLEVLRAVTAEARAAGEHITSDYRSARHPIEAAKIRRGGRPGQHASGLAFDTRARSMREIHAAAARQRARFEERGLVEGRDFNFITRPHGTGLHLHTQMTPGGSQRFYGSMGSKSSVAGAPPPGAERAARPPKGVGGGEDRSMNITVRPSPAPWVGEDAFKRRGTTGAPYTLGDVSNDNSRKMDQKNTFNTTIHTTGDTREAGRILTRANHQTALLLQNSGAIV